MPGVRVVYFTHTRYQQHRRIATAQVPRQSPAQRFGHTILLTPHPPLSGGAVSRSPWGLLLTTVVIATNSIPNTKNSPLIYKSKNYYLVTKNVLLPNFTNVALSENWILGSEPNVDFRLLY